MIDYDRYPHYSARCEGRDIVRAGLAPYLQSVGLTMPPAAPVPMLASEAPAIRADMFKSIQASIRTIARTYARVGKALQRTIRSTITNDSGEPQ